MVTFLIGIGALCTGYLLRLVVESLGFNIYSIDARPQPEHGDPRETVLRSEPRYNFVALICEQNISCGVYPSLANETLVPMKMQIW
jgi:hypothetical protein